MKARKAPSKEFSQQIRDRLLKGSYVSLDSLTPEELGATQDMLLNGELEIVHSNCRPHLVAKIDRTIIDN